MTQTDRGEERRRLLEAVRSGSEAGDPSDEEAEAGGSAGERPEPAPDGGTVTLAAPLFHCDACDRTYLEPPVTCDGCGGSSFERRTVD